MHVIGELILAALIVWGGYAAVRSVTAGAARHLPAAVRSRRPGASKRETAWDKVRAQDWLDRRKAKRERAAARPSGTERAGSAIRTTVRGIKATGRGTRRLAGAIPRPPRNRTSVPSVGDFPPRGAAVLTAPAPNGSKPASPAPATPATPDGRHLDMSTPRGSVGPHHAAVNAYVASFEPESDGDLIRFMSGEAAGMAGYSHSMEQLSEHLLNSVGLDPAAIQGMTEFAQAVTEAAALMTRANAKFQQTYQGVRETVASGTVLPFRGRWMTGESA